MFLPSFGLYLLLLTPFFPQKRTIEKLKDKLDRETEKFNKERLDRETEVSLANYINYRKIPKISPGAYIFQRPFLRGLVLEGLIFGGTYLWREICVSKSFGLAL